MVSYVGCYLEMDGSCQGADPLTSNPISLLWIRSDGTGFEDVIRRGLYVIRVSFMGTRFGDEQGFLLSGLFLLLGQNLQR